MPAYVGFIICWALFLPPGPKKKPLLLCSANCGFIGLLRVGEAGFLRGLIKREGKNWGRGDRKAVTIAV